MPKYLRPIRDVEAHKLTRLEMAVRMIIFCPPLMLFSLPQAALLAVLPVGLIFLQFAPSAVDTIITDPSTYRVELITIVLVIALLIFSNMLAKAIRRYFLPFG